MNCVEKHRVSRVGYLPDRETMLLDHGGTQQRFSPNQFDFGMGMFTPLDGYGHAGKWLVRLNDPTACYDRSVGAATPEQFVDNQSLPSSRLWGQGAALQVSNFSIGYRPINCGDQAEGNENCDNGNH